MSIYYSDTYHSFHLIFFFNDTATTEIYTLSLHDALPISVVPKFSHGFGHGLIGGDHRPSIPAGPQVLARVKAEAARSEEHTSELQSQSNLVCRLLLEKKKNKHNNIQTS